MSAEAKVAELGLQLLAAATAGAVSRADERPPPR